MSSDADYDRKFMPYGFDLDKTNKKAYPFNRFYTYLGSEKGVWRHPPASTDERIFLYKDNCKPWENNRNWQSYQQELSKIKSEYEIIKSENSV